ncbi:MAG: response regulator transcription factor [Chitinophagales bacterium]|jgi:DNA-binding NarL/FixJ family response regulator|nr:response regulator transcription factor [Chitinophagales bacterium]
MAIRVTIFDDNHRFRESIAVLLSGSPGFTLAEAYADANDTAGKIAASQPDVVLMDIEMPGTNGLQALGNIKRHYPDLNVLMQTVFDDEQKIFDAICNGASGYILKNTAPDKILDAIVETYQGGAPMSPVIARKVLQLMQSKHATTAQTEPVEIFNLTPREKEVLLLMVDGLSYKMIADRCKISFETVRSHINNIYKKLHVGTMTEAVAKAIKQKIV